MLATLIAVLALLLAPAANAGSRRHAPTPDPAPQAHGKHVTMLPNCPPLANVHHRSYVVEMVNGHIVCAGTQS